MYLSACDKSKLGKFFSTENRSIIAIYLNQLGFSWFTAIFVPKRGGEGGGVLTPNLSHLLTTKICQIFIVAHTKKIYKYNINR